MESINRWIENTSRALQKVYDAEGDKQLSWFSNRVRIWGVHHLLPLRVVMGIAKVTGKHGSR